VGEDRPLAELPRQHVHDGERKARIRAQADELPGPRADLQVELRSYRDLPLRYGEFGQCHRNEPSGALHGIMRVRGFTQDDGHIFVTEDHILDECVAYTAQLQKVYADFGFTDILYKVATRPDNRVGSDELWDKAEHAVHGVAAALWVSTSWSRPVMAPSTAPRSNTRCKDALGRQWQCGTMQVDFNTAERLGANTSRKPAAAPTP
jgi:threonyl-tRNA synthetase